MNLAPELGAPFDFAVTQQAPWLTQSPVRQEHADGTSVGGEVPPPAARLPAEQTDKRAASSIQGAEGLTLPWTSVENTCRSK